MRIICYCDACGLETKHTVSLSPTDGSKKFEICVECKKVSKAIRQ